MVDQIRAAAKDDNINGMILNLREMSQTSVTKLKYIAKALDEFKAEGKKIVATGSFYNQSQYYLASFADEIYMAKDGTVVFEGYGAYRLYYKELLEKLNISTHVFRVGQYKSAIEPYTRSNMSEQAREANSVWLNSLWRAYVQTVAKNRNIGAENISPSKEQLLKFMQDAHGDSALLAKNLGLVDELLTDSEVRSKLAEHFGSDGKDSTNYISIYDYQIPPANTSANKIAVVVASGTIVDGLDGDNQVGGDSMASLLRDARLDDNIKAVILRIDSPGGSALASEKIRNEMIALKNAGKPIIASMSSVAASGGYWIATGADKIIAEPTTITGSIGVFGLLTTFEKALAKYGVFNDGLGTAPFSEIKLSRELPSFFSEYMQLGVENSYRRFILLVSEARNIPVEKVDNIAQGRVWSGEDALKIKLVDQMGDFDDAISAAVELAKLESFELDWMSTPLTPAQEFLQRLLSNTVSWLNLQTAHPLPDELQEITTLVSDEVKLFSSFNDPNGQYVICQECLLF